MKDNDKIASKGDLQACFVSHWVQSQPIRRGDVVQVIDSRLCKVVMRASEEQDRLGCWTLNDGYTYADSELVRIGRACYYPDGTKVED